MAVHGHRIAFHRSFDSSGLSPLLAQDDGMEIEGWRPLLAQDDGMEIEGWRPLLAQDDEGGGHPASIRMTEGNRDRSANGERQ
jgi:hypothetical protein